MFVSLNDNDIISNVFDVEEEKKCLLMRYNNETRHDFEDRYDFTIIIPVYNAEKYIERTVKSAIKQDNVNIQIVIVNDGSTDNSGKICESLVTEGNYIYICHDNKGQSAARNEGLNLSEGRYIFFLDADDCLIENTLKPLYEQMEQNNLDVLSFDAIELRTNNIRRNMKSSVMIEPGVVVSGEEYILRNGFNVPVPPWNYVFRREFLLTGGFRFREGLFHEDCEFTAHFFPYVKRFSYINSQVYIHDFTSVSTMRSRNIKKSIDLIHISSWIYRDAEVMKGSFPARVVDEIEQYAASEAFGAIASCVHNGFSLNWFLNDKHRKKNLSILIKPGRKYWMIYILLRIRQYWIITVLIKLFSKKRE